MSAQQNAPTRRDRIVVLLDNYVDVESGLRDRRGDGEHIPLMSACWNHPSYAELDRLLGVMRQREPHTYWHLSQTYFYSVSRRVLQCPRCRGVMPSWSSTNFHKHGHTSVAVVPKVVRVVRAGVHTPIVEDGVTWLERNWQGDVFLPDELMAAVA